LHIGFRKRYRGNAGATSLCPAAPKLTLLEAKQESNYSRQRRFGGSLLSFSCEPRKKPVENVFGTNKRIRILTDRYRSYRDILVFASISTRFGSLAAVPTTSPARKDLLW
jgi:hypothetical protein